MLDYFKALAESWPLAVTIIGLSGIIVFRLSFKESMRKEEERLRGDRSIVVHHSHKDD